MKIPRLIPAVVLAALSSASAWAQEGGSKVALTIPDGHYLTAAPNGGVNAKGKTITARQIFILTDATGTKLADGDAVTISTSSASASGRTSCLSEKADGTIARIARADASTSFVIKNQEGGGITLKTASGKFVTATEAGLGTTATETEALVLKIVPNPEIAPPAAAVSPAPEASPAKATE